MHRVEQYLLKTLEKNQGKPVPDVLNITFHSVDRELANLASEKGSSSGCTAAVAFLRLEDDSGQALTPGEESSPGSTKDADGEATAAGQSTERGSGDGLWGKLSKRFDSSDPKNKGKQSTSPRRVLYTANVGDARAVLW